MSDRSRAAAWTDTMFLGAVPGRRGRVLQVVLFLGAFFAAVRSVDAVSGGDPRVVVVAAGLALSLLMTGLAVHGWRVALCVRAAWVFPVTLLSSGVAMVVDTERRGADYGGAYAGLLGPALTVAGLAGGVLCGYTLARMNASPGGGVRAGGDSPEPWMRALGVVLLLGASHFAVQLVGAVPDGDWRRLVASVGYGTALLLGGLGLNGVHVGLSIRLVWLFPATMAVLGLAMIMDPDYGDPAWSGAAAIGTSVVQFGTAMVVAGLAGGVLYVSAVAERTPRRH
ncbi:hypothetical protein [Actinomadura algeriensis]|uniref:Integral membrane protein n=1 Tax=Actinomadura algeriensis TaxID=1679523 RepID=A0ABR9JJ81_9ACTN|nr:hypothetical protein [Actinomadura algeriensis]MBE1530578.1 hypothetical protein [Actinomadura algeriensis]